MTAPRPRPCQFGCDAEAAWVLVACWPEAQPLDTCTADLAEARALVTRALPPGTPLLLRRAPRSPRVLQCEWLLPGRRWPWVERCTAPGVHTDEFEGNVVRHCGAHDASPARQEVGAR